MVILREISLDEKGRLPSVLGESMKGEKSDGRLVSGGKSGIKIMQGERQSSAGMGKGAGVAVDIGTTTVVAYLWDFSLGKVLHVLSRENCQTRLGADVMMRIMHAQRGKGEELHRMLVEQVEEMVEELLGFWQELGNPLLSGEEIPMSVVGNPAMCHFFLNKDVAGLAGAPFRSAYAGNYRCTGEDVGFRRGSQIKIQVLSGIAAHVGSDALAVLGVAESPGETGTKLIVDLGTNAEMILIARESRACCSTAAGPALEGKGISCGARAKPGAVTGVKIAPKTGNIVLEHISGSAPLGMTGTGILELMEGLCRCGILSRDGYLLDRGEAEEMKIHPDLAKCLVMRQGQRGFLLYKGEREIVLYQDDVRNIQLAKGAILAGIQCILKKYSLLPEDVEEVMVAGALGNHLREEAVLRLGLFPAAFRGKLSLIGNGAGAGAVKMLAEPGFAAEMEWRAGEIAHVELAEMEDFKKNMVDGMEFREY